jgi:hypothetical protein
MPMKPQTIYARVILLPARSADEWIADPIVDNIPEHQVVIEDFAAWLS